MIFENNTANEGGCIYTNEFNILEITAKNFFA